MVCEGPRVITAALDRAGTDTRSPRRCRRDTDRESRRRSRRRMFHPGPGTRVRCRRSCQRDTVRAGRVRRRRVAPPAPRRARGCVTGARRAAAQRSRQRRHAHPQRRRGRRRDNCPRAGFGRRVQSQDRAGIGRRVLRNPDRGGCARRDGLGGARKRRYTPRRRAELGCDTAGNGRPEAARRDRARPRDPRPRRRSAPRRPRSRSRCTAPNRSTSRWPAPCCASRPHANVGRHRDDRSRHRTKRPRPRRRRYAS